MVTAAAELARWAVGLDPDSVPEPVLEAARRHLLDGVGTALAARRTQAVTAAVAVARGLGGPAEAGVLGDDQRLSAPAAAFGTGALVHGLDFDDTHAGGLVHATAIVLPTVLAVGQQVGASGAESLAAAVVGYEVVCRVAAGSPHGFHARGLHATQVAGTLAAAAVTARLLGLTAESTCDALGIAGSSSGGLLEFLHTGASTKQLHPGAAAMSGILAARLAAAGATGPSTVLEGPCGIYAALSARPADLDAVVGDLGTRWETTRITLKPYPSCQLMHATLAAVERVRPKLTSGVADSVDAADIVEIVAEVHPDSAAVVCEPAADKLAPRSPYDGKFSLPWSVAALLLDGAVDVSTYDPASIRRPEVAALAGRVRSVLGPADVVAADAPGRVVVRLRDGREVRGEVPCSSGGPAAPLSAQQVRAKFDRNAGPGSGELADAVLRWGIDDDVTPDRLGGLSAAVARGSGHG